MFFVGLLLECDYWDLVMIWMEIWLEIKFDDKIMILYD